MKKTFSRGYTGLVAVTFVGVLGVAFLSSPSTTITYPTDQFRSSFAAHLEATSLGSDPDVQGLVFNFYDTGAGEGRWIYLRISAEKILWHLKRGEAAASVTLADKMLTWQQLSSAGALAKSYGAFPSLITEDPINPGEWIAAGALDGTGNPAYYSGDGLVILEALSELYNETGDLDYRTAGIALGGWLLDMIDEPNAWLTSFGYAGTAYPAPFKYVDSAGNYSDQIVPSECFNYIGALTHLSAITSDASYGARVDGARDFYADSQHADGYYFDHYTTWPNYPAAPPNYNPADWAPFHVGNAQVLADNVLNSALGAVKAGDTAAANLAFTWINQAVDQNGGVPGYLSQSGGHGFGVQDVYFDVVSSGQYRSLAQWLNQTARATQAVAFLEAAQSASGGFSWGLYQKLGLSATGATDDEAPHTGFWATADMSTYATTLTPAIGYDSLIPQKRLTLLTATPAGVDIGSTPTQMTATATYSDSSTASVIANVFWHQDDITKATITQAGLVTPVGTGNSNAYATIGRFTDAAFLATAAP